jgi:hydrogenase maturation protein HypF
MLDEATSLKAIKIGVDGIVQGVGFRPYVCRLARGLDLNGWVLNRNDGVLIHVQGESDHIDRFFELLPARAPHASVISHLDSYSVPVGNYEGFTIKKSRLVSGSATGVSPDIAVCPLCLADTVYQQHRLAYPLVNCTSCGPRFSIISSLPYDRANTSMRHFEMCSECSKEYHDPDDRRFHAQPLACNNCGPVYRIAWNPLIASSQPVLVSPGVKGSLNGCPAENGLFEKGSSATANGFETGLNIPKLCSIIEGGGVVTLKGTGGYNLVCDASNHGAVERIREIKGRERKPFAVMFRDIEKVKEWSTADAREESLLQSWRRPVVILKQTGHTPGPPVGADNGSEGLTNCISLNVNRGISTIGAILPYMPIHYLLFGELKIDALVFTSANISGDPIVADDGQAASLFAGTTDAVVTYDREILNPVDDSVCRLAGGNIQIIRRSRGFVPEAFNLPFLCENIFAAGSDLKNTFAIGKGFRAYLSQHNGDMENYQTLNRYRDTFDHFSDLFNFSPRHIACDLHPDYHSTRFARRLAEETGSSILHVQHHHAHIASCMAEKGINETVIGVCFDGTGFGDDGNIWGSEFMTCDYLGYTRHAHFSYIPLPGGDAAIREPWRIALACLRMMNHGYADQWLNDTLPDISPEKKETVDNMISGRINCPLSCGAGRLFDAVAALTGICMEAGYDGEAPMLLESVCSPGVRDSYDFFTDSFELLDQIMYDIVKKVPPGTIASRFHNSIAKAVVSNTSLINSTTGIDRVILSGGVFQNSYLLNRVVELLKCRGLQVFTSHMVPVNDGGLALGQLAIAAANQ